MFEINFMYKRLRFIDALQPFGVQLQIVYGPTRDVLLCTLLFEDYTKRCIVSLGTENWLCCSSVFGITRRGYSYGVFVNAHDKNVDFE